MYMNYMIIKFYSLRTFICLICVSSGKAFAKRLINDLNSGRITFTRPQRDPVLSGDVVKTVLHASTILWPT